MKRILVLALAMVMTFAFAAHAELKIAVIDMQKALETSKAGAEGAAKLKAMYEDTAKVGDAKKKELERLETDLKQKSGVLTDEARQKKLKEYQAKSVEFDRFLNESSKELQTLERKLTNEIGTALARLASTYAKEKGYNMVLQRGEAGVIWTEESMDITAEIIKRYDAEWKK